jgi:hypothetical protein
VTGTADVFAERLLQVIDEGRRTATYKLALLLALIDACAAEADHAGGAPPALHTRTIAEHVLRIYLPQTRSYLGSDGDPLHLRQITLKRSAVLAAIVRLHLRAEAAGCRTPGEVARRLPDEFERCLDEVERTFARYPLRLLQVVGKEHRPFLYDLDWGESVSLSALHAPGGGLVRFRPGAGDHLVRLAPLLRPLIELHWTRMVARINRINTEDERLRDHLFGADRRAFPKPIRAGLADLQGGACFYCGDRLGRRIEVDHFMPWARWPNDAIENLVLADGCNGHKRDYLAALPHVDRWARRLVAEQSQLADLADSSQWESDPGRSLALGRSSYAHLPAGTPLWLRHDEFTDDDPALITSRLADLPTPS